MSVDKIKYGSLPDGREVYQYIISNGKLSVHVINYGGIITNIITKDKNGNDTDVILGKANLEEYLHNDGYLNAVIGRFANRISKCKFELNGTTYTVGKNNGNNSLHGGVVGFDKKLWDAKEVDDEDAIILSYTSPDGEEGFPGTLDVKIKYSITPENGLKLEYWAVSDKDTVCNLTNHAYFNINGYKSGKIYGHRLRMASSFFTPNNDECMPVGEVLSVKGTPFDFTTEKAMGEGMKSDYPQVKMFGGFDHYFVLDGFGTRKVLSVTGDISGITMEMITNQPGVQLYTSNELESANKGDYENGRHDGFCLETQVFPDCVNFRHFPGATLKKDEEYYHITEYRFV